MLPLHVLKLWHHQYGHLVHRQRNGGFFTTAQGSTSALQRKVIAGNGDNGIGIAAPLARLHVRAAANSSALIIDTSTGAQYVHYREVSGVRQKGVFGVTPVPRQVVTGSRSSGAAFLSLLQALAAYGEIVDQTTA